MCVCVCVLERDPIIHYDVFYLYCTYYNNTQIFRLAIANF